MSKVTLRSLSGVFVAAGLLIAVVTGPCAAQVNPYTSTLTGMLGSFTVISTVSTTPEMIEGVAWYKFDYEVRFTGTVYSLKTFNVNNPTQREYRYASNDDLTYFPTQADWTTIPSAAKWTSPSYAPAPRTIHFWFYARSSQYQVVTSSLTGSASRTASGNVLGIATPLPEPTSVAGLGLGLLGTMGFALRRARLRAK